jgi:hypothetical protein
VDENKTPLFQELIYFSKKKGDLSPKKGDLSPVLSPTRNKKENKKEGRVREGEGKGGGYIPGIFPVYSLCSIKSQFVQYKVTIPQNFKK